MAAESAGRTPAPGRELAGRCCTAAVVLARRASLITFVVLAVLGAAVAPAAVTLLWAPAAGLFLAMTGATVAARLGLPGHTRRTAWRCFGAGLLFPPFTSGLALLGHAGAVILIGMLVSGALSLLVWGLDAVEGGPQAARRHLAEVRHVLPDLPADALLREWRAAAAGLDRGADPETRALAAELRSELLDELARRHPREVDAWLHDPDGGPEPGIRAG